VSRPPEPVFLERQSYRRRRWSDAARLMPVVGLILLILPLLWADQATTSGGILYIFCVWALLIAGTRIIARRLSDYDPFVESKNGSEGAELRDGGAR